MSGDVGGERDQSAAAVVTSATSAGVERPWRLRSLSTGDLNAVPTSSRSLPHLPFTAAVPVPGGQLSTEFSVDPESRRSLSSLQSAAARTWCDGRALRPGGSLSFVAVETPLTSSASSAATTAGGGGGSDVSGCVPDSLDDDDPAPSTSLPPPPTSATLPTSQAHTERLTDGLLMPADDWNQSDLRRVASGVVTDCQCPSDSSNLAVCHDEDESVDLLHERLQQKRRQRQFRRRQRATRVGQPSSNSFDELQHRTPPKLVHSSASLTSAAPGSETAVVYRRRDAWNWTAREGSCRSMPENCVAVDPLPLQNGKSRPEWSATSASTRTARSTASPVVDGGLRLPDAWSQRSTLHAGKPLTMTTTWLANRVQTTVAYPPRRARNAWSKSLEIHPKTGGGVSSLRGSASATLISVRRRNSLHAVFVDDSRTAVLKDVVIPIVLLRCHSWAPQRNFQLSQTLPFCRFLFSPLHCAFFQGASAHLLGHAPWLEQPLCPDLHFTECKFPLFGG